MSTLLVLRSNEHPTGSPNDPSTPEAISTSTNTIPIPTIPNREASAQETRAPELLANIVAPALNTAALSTSAGAIGSRGMSMQTVSTQTDNNIDLQPAIPVITPITSSGTTGLYGTLPGRGSPSRLPVLQKPKHSAAAAHYLRTADARDLPSYPSAGFSHPEAAGAAAALLAHRFHKPVEIWKPNPFPAAGAAASLAHANPRRVGKAALGDLFPQQNQMSESSRRWSLNGAVGAMQGSKARWRSDSFPAPLTTQQEAEAARAGNSALVAATIVHMPTVRRSPSPHFKVSCRKKPVDARRVPQQDKRKSDIPCAATISIFKGNRDTSLLPDTHKHKTLVQPDPQHPATTPPSRRYNYSNIEEAARKVAAERLAKIGYNPGVSGPVSLLGAQGAQASLSRAYPVVSLDSSGLGQSRETNADMQDNLNRVDAKKRGENAILLMSTAQRNVQARISGIDKQVAESRELLKREDWDAKATGVAQAGSDRRMEHYGKISIGGGAYMTPGEIDAIAEKNVRPVLDEINRNAEAERARELEVQLDVEESKRVQDLQRIREREVREDIKRAKAVEKVQEKRRKEEQKRASKERKQLAKIDSKRSREPVETNNMVDLRSPTSPTSPKSDSSEGGIRGLINRFKRRHSRQISHDEKNTIANDAPAKGSPTIPTFSGGHRAAMAEQQEQQRTAETNNGVAATNKTASPRPHISRIPRPVSAVILPRTNEATESLGSVRPTVIADAPSPITKRRAIEVKRRHSLPSVGSSGLRFKGRGLGDGIFLPWSADQGAKKGRDRTNGKGTRDFSKANGRIMSTEDHSEYLDEARDTFSQQQTTFNRPTSGYFPQDEQRLSIGETSISSRFRENL